MKALLGKLAKVIQGDVQGSRQLQDFIAKGSDDTGVITLSNGDTYEITTTPVSKDEQHEVA